jgi:hypothetical protein
MQPVAAAVPLDAAQDEVLQEELKARRQLVQALSALRFLLAFRQQEPLPRVLVSTRPEAVRLRDDVMAPALPARSHRTRRSFPARQVRREYRQRDDDGDRQHLPLVPRAAESARLRPFRDDGARVLQQEQLLSLASRAPTAL